ncbi:MAG: type VI secretion system baseplate subunit TssE [Proteobacteria bacterium]|nr:type VI secretion system baseplate subunit TssE [Pseudomonadota bacterium]MBU1583465.1 type VI secretion system baseplate subunit TssE [Pseudomonadota bacterium]MBU2451943.1 type VI secretion system baseplate subunit TssE [Pseudomonadota bacterium]MBU2628470.1 type VI secretion system baseplate subunit TssE [Pseudomonadota bacterium]
MALFNKFMRNNTSKHSEDSLQDIAENINNILNTKKDYGSPLRDFGIRDLNEFNDRNGMIDSIIQEVTRCVELYEPRVKIVEVIKDNKTDMFKLSFKIKLLVRNSEKTLKMVFDTTFSRFLVENT